MGIYFEVLFLIIIVVIFGYLFFYSADILLAPSVHQSTNSQVCFGKYCFSVDLAQTNAEREKGLMNVKQLDRNRGMLFIFEKEGIYPFWMKNTLIPLDIIWIDVNNKIVFVSENAQPCKSLICPQISSNQKAKYVLEINAGLAREAGLEVGLEASFYGIIN